MNSREGWRPSHGSVCYIVRVMETHTHANTRWRHKQAPTHTSLCSSAMPGFKLMRSGTGGTWGAASSAPPLSRWGTFPYVQLVSVYLPWMLSRVCFDGSRCRNVTRTSGMPWPHVRRQNLRYLHRTMGFHHSACHYLLKDLCASLSISRWNWKCPLFMGDVVSVSTFWFLCGSYSSWWLSLQWPCRLQRWLEV